MVAISLLSSILLATAAFAFPTSVETTSQTLTNATSNTSYSGNWAGASLDYPDGTFTSVTGTFKVPTPHAPEGSAAVWVGIDGDTCLQASLQTGIEVSLTNGHGSYIAWYDWLPQKPGFFNGFSIKAGDEIRLTVTATSTNGGTAKIENLTTKKHVMKVFQSESAALCRQNAEWIVETYTQDFCNFGTVEFTNAYAMTTANHRVTPVGAKTIILQKNGQDITSVEENQDGVTVKYL